MNSTMASSPTRHPFLKAVFVLLMFFFYFGLTLVYPFPIMSQVIRLAGIGLIGFYIVSFDQRKQKIAPEIILYSLFILWATLTGMFIAVDQYHFWDLIKTLFQILGLIFAISGFATVFGNISSNLYAIIISVFVLDVYSFFTRDFGFTINDPLAGMRASSFLLNPNNFAFYNLIGVFALLFVMKKQKGNLFKIAGYLLIIFFAFGIVYSVSQKSFLSLIVLISTWIWFCFRKQAIRRLNFLLLIFVIVFLSILIYFTLNNTYLGVRLQNSLVGDDASLQTRMKLYQEGWTFFLLNPITGVGIANFTIHSSLQAYAHSDYIEVLSTTGIVGFLLYFPIFPVLWRRINRIQQRSSNSVVIYEMGLFKAFIVTLLFIAFGRPNFTDIDTMFLLASLIGYTFYLEGTLNQYQLKHSESPSSNRLYPNA